MDTNNRNEWRNRSNESERSSSTGVRSDSDQRPVLRNTTSSNVRDISDFSGEIPGGTINNTSAGSGAMLGSATGSSRDYERNPNFNRNREGETYRGYGQGQGSNYDYGRSEDQYRDQYGRSSSPYQQEQESSRGENRNYGQDYNQPGNRNQQYQGGGQERGYQGQHRTPHKRYAGGQGGHDYGQAPDWNQSHGSNWANENRRRQEQQRGSQASFGGHGDRFEDQNQYSRERQQNRNYEGLSRDRDYRNQPDRGYNSGHDYGAGSYAGELNRDYGRTMRRDRGEERYERQNYGSRNTEEGRERGGGPTLGRTPGYENYGGSNEMSGGIYGGSNRGGGPYVGEGYERPRNYGGPAQSGGGAGRSSESGRERNRNYGAGTGREPGSYSGASSYGGGGNYGAGYGPNRRGTPDYGSNPRESSMIKRERDYYRNRNANRNEQEDQDRGFLDKVGDRVQSWFDENDSTR